MAKKSLIIYASVTGNTEKVANRFKQVFEKKGEKIPMGWGIDDDGIVTDDPKKVQSGGPGAVLPLGSTDILIMSILLLSLLSRL